MRQGKPWTTGVILCLGLTAALLIAGCGKKKEPLSPDSAVITDGVYANHFFGFSLTLPTGWYSLTPQGMEAKNAWAEKILESDKPSQQKDRPSSYNLFFVAQNQPGNPTAFNPTLSGVAEKIPDQADDFNGRNYLENIRKVLGSSRFGATFPTGISQVSLGGKPFFLLQATLSRPGLTITQEYYASAQKGYILALVRGFQTKEQGSILDAAIRSLRFQ